MESRGKKKGIFSMFRGIGHALNGLKYAKKYEQSFLIIGITIFLVLIMGFGLEINNIQWAISIFLIGTITAIELINTSLEAVIDLICPEVHPLAKAGKDTASASVFIMSIIATIIWGIMFFPKIINIVMEVL